VNIFR